MRERARERLTITLPVTRSAPRAVEWVIQKQSSVQAVEGATKVSFEGWCILWQQESLGLLLEESVRSTWTLVGATICERDERRRFQFWQPGRSLHGPDLFNELPFLRIPYQMSKAFIYPQKLVGERVLFFFFCGLSRVGTLARILLEIFGLQARRAQTLRENVEAFFRKKSQLPGKMRTEKLKYLEEDKRARTNVQNGLVFLFLLSFIIFSSLCTKTVAKPLNSKKKSWRKSYEEKVRKSAKKCEKVPKRFCPLVVAL